MGAGAQGPAADLSVDRQEHRRDEKGAGRIPAGAGRADPAAGDADAVGRALHGTEWAAIASTAAVYATAKVACRACPSHRRAPPDRRFPASAVVRCRVGHDDHTITL